MVGCRSLLAQDLALHSRVVDYREGDWARLTYAKRRFFEFGGWLAVRPIEELPYFRVLMRRVRDSGDMQAWVTLHEIEPTIEEMRHVLAQRGELANRDLAMGERRRVDSYRGRKDSALALNYLWHVGEAMVARRTGTFERVYAPTEAVAPSRYLDEVSDEEADEFFLMKAVRSAGLSRLLGARGALLRPVTQREVVAWRERKLASRELVEVDVEGIRSPYVALASEAAALESLSQGRTPRGWRPLAATTTDEVTFLSPLDPAIHDRDRTRAIFDFDYKWGVYDKLENRKFGYYDLPMLWGDRFVGRMDAKVDRVTGTLKVLGLWHEDDAPRDDPALTIAFERGLERLGQLVRANPPQGTLLDGRDPAWASQPHAAMRRGPAGETQETA